MSFADAQTGGDKIFFGGLFEGVGERRTEKGHDEGMACADGHAKHVSAVKREKEIAESFAEAMGNAFVKTLQHMAGECHGPSVQVNVGKEFGAVEETKAVRRALRGGFLDVLDDGHLGDQLRSFVVEELHIVGAVTK